MAVLAALAVHPGRRVLHRLDKSGLGRSTSRRATRADDLPGVSVPSMAQRVVPLEKILGIGNTLGLGRPGSRGRGSLNMCIGTKTPGIFGIRMDGNGEDNSHSGDSGGSIPGQPGRGMTRNLS